MSVPSADVADLLEKYRAIVRLRRHEEDAAVTVRAAMRALAKRYPGSLRELDELPMETLEEKVAVLTAMRDGAPAPPWVGAQIRFHALVRGALVAKRYLRDASTEAEHFKKWTDDPEAHLWATELAAIHRPPRGRLLDLIFARLARELCIDADEARRLVFTTERPAADSGGRGASARRAGRT